jgi:hypothetical protein
MRINPFFDVLDTIPCIRDIYYNFKKSKEGNIQFDDQLYFTQLRIMLEHVFRKVNSSGSLHDACSTRK